MSQAARLSRSLAGLFSAPADKPPARPRHSSDMTDRPILDVTDHLAPLRRYARALTRDTGDSEDLVQDTMLRVIERGESLRDLGNIRGWLFTVLRNIFLDRQRSERASRAREAAVAGATADWVPARQEDFLRLMQVRAAFDQLPAAQREALQLVALEGMSCKAAAEHLDIPMGTLVSRIGRARASLRALEGEDGRDG